MAIIIMRIMTFFSLSLAIAAHGSVLGDETKDRRAKDDALRKTVLAYIKCAKDKVQFLDDAVSTAASLVDRLKIACSSQFTTYPGNAQETSAIQEEVQLYLVHVVMRYRAMQHQSQNNSESN